METTLRLGLSHYATVLFGLLILGAVVGTTEAYTPLIYVFGDCTVDVGENNCISSPLVPQANITPYGKTFFFHPTGRFCNGKLVPDFICDFLGIPLSVPYLQLTSVPVDPYRFVGESVNFASGGSGILDGTHAFEGVINLDAQITQFQNVVTTLKSEMGSSVATFIIQNSIVIFSTGGNDITFYLTNPTLQARLAIEIYIQVLVFKFKQAIDTVINSGARKIVVSGLKPIGCLPIIVANGTTGTCIDSVNKIAQTFNDVMLNAVKDINAGGVAEVSFVTQYDFTLNLIQNNQGFTHGSNACCGSGPFNGNYGGCGRGSYSLCPNVDEYYFWDFSHPTQRAYSLIAKQYETGDTSFIQPINVLELSLLTF